MAEHAGGKESKDSDSAVKNTYRAVKNTHRTCSFVLGSFGSCVNLWFYERHNSAQNCLVQLLLVQHPKRLKNGLDIFMNVRSSLLNLTNVDRISCDSQQTLYGLTS